MKKSVLVLALGALFSISATAFAEGASANLGVSVTVVNSTDQVAANHAEDNVKVAEHHEKKDHGKVEHKAEHKLDKAEHKDEHKAEVVQKVELHSEKADAHAAAKAAH